MTQGRRFRTPVFESSAGGGGCCATLTLRRRDTSGSKRRGFREVFPVAGVQGARRRCRRRTHALAKRFRPTPLEERRRRSTDGAGFPLKTRGSPTEIGSGSCPRGCGCSFVVY